MPTQISTVPQQDGQGLTPDQQHDQSDATDSRPVGGPVAIGWRECTLTRAWELETLCDSVLADVPPGKSQIFKDSISGHLKAARQAALGAKLDPKRPRWIRGGEARRERAMSNLDAAEVALLNIAPAKHILGELPSLLEHVECHLVADDPRRKDFERIVRRLSGRTETRSAADLDESEADIKQRAADNERREKAVEEERGRIASITRAASSAALREQIRVRSFRNILVATTIIMGLLAAGVAIVGLASPETIPLCFAPEEQARAIVVCPTEQSAEFSTARTNDEEQEDIDIKTRQTVSRADLLVVEGIGLIAAALAAAGAIRKIRGTSERYQLPVALIALKLPTGAITAFLGLLLMRGQFVPGLSALDTSAQILAWALVFGYSQQLFTRFVDRQGQTVLDGVRGADIPRSTPDPGVLPLERTP